jgi:hypothetical protein
MFEISHKALMRISGDVIVLNKAITESIIETYKIPVSAPGSFTFPIIIKIISTDKGDGISFYMKDCNFPCDNDNEIESKLKIVLKRRKTTRMYIDIGSEKLEVNPAFEILKKITRLNQWTIPLHPENVNSGEHNHLFDIFPNDVVQFLLKKIRDGEISTHDKYKELSLVFNSLFIEEADSSYHVDLTNTNDFIKRYPYNEDSINRKTSKRIDKNRLGFLDKLKNLKPTNNFEKAKFTPNFEKAKKEGSYLFITKISSKWVLELFNSSQFPIYVNGTSSHKYELLIDKEANLICLQKNYSGETFEINNSGNIEILISPNTYPILYNMLKKAYIEYDEDFKAPMVEELCNDAQLVFKL